MRAQCLFLEHNKESLFKKRKKVYNPLHIMWLYKKRRKEKTSWKKGKRQPPPPLLQAYVHLLCSVPLYTQQRMECNNGTHNACVCASVVPAFFGRGKERDLLLLVYCFADIKLCRAKKGTHTAAECVDYLALV